MQHEIGKAIGNIYHQQDNRYYHNKIKNIVHSQIDSHDQSLLISQHTWNLVKALWQPAERSAKEANLECKVGEGTGAAGSLGRQHEIGTTIGNAYQTHKYQLDKKTQVKYQVDKKTQVKLQADCQDQAHIVGRNTLNHVRAHEQPTEPSAEDANLECKVGDCAGAAGRLQLRAHG